MRILVSGSTGLIGSALVTVLKSGGHDVVRLVRSARVSEEASVGWDPAQGTIGKADLTGIDAVVHLAGEGIASGRWTAQKKARIRDSRVDGTRLLAETLAGMEPRPGVLVCASAIGFYGDRGDALLDETSESGTGFLADVCRQWEAAADPARQHGIRVAHLRTGVVLSSHGGALSKMRLPFRIGAGGIVGTGRQYWSWIHLDDLVAAVMHILKTDALEGPVNGVAPNPVTNREFTYVLGKVLHRPTLFPMPGFAARLLLGEMANELLLCSARVRPRRLEETAFPYRYPGLEEALRHELEP